LKRLACPDAWLAIYPDAYLHVTRVLVDGRALSDDSAFRGIGTYVRGLLSALGQQPGMDVGVLATPGTPLPADVTGVRIHRRAPGRLRYAEDELLLPRDLRRWSADVVHSPALHPPRRTPGALVQTLHDAFPLTLGAAALRRDRARLERLRQRCRRADAVIAISNFVAEQASEIFGIDSGRVHVIHHGVAERFRPAVDAPAMEPYLFMVAEYDPRKAHDVAFDIVGRLAAQGCTLPLKVAGRIAPWYAERMAALVAASPRPDLVSMLGYVSDDELVQLYQGATALLVTSKGEGFGFPALEAMASGTPVVAFDNSATREVVGEDALLVPDGDIEGVVSALARLAQDPGLRRSYSERGLTRAREFTWQECARRHAELFRSLDRR
jgi:glycosyltransferase involved in cell wall biosynthesis